MELNHTVTVREDGRDLLSILRRGMGLSASLIKKLKRARGFFVNGVPVFTNHIVREGDVVTAYPDTVEAGTDIPPEHGDLDILFEDDWFIALNKPAGVIVHPSRSRYTGTLANFLVGYLSSCGNPAVCHAVNRLDRDTSGIVLFAKNAHAKAAVSPAMAKAEKEYRAVVYGVFDEPNGVINMPIMRLNEGDMLRGVTDGGQRTVTLYETLCVKEFFGKGVSALRLRLETGRTHQIRVHCSHLGHPLIGDTLYKSADSIALSDKLEINAQLLHAQSLSFKHPATGAEIRLHCPVRDDMKRFIDCDM